MCGVPTSSYTWNSSEQFSSHSGAVGTPLFSLRWEGLCSPPSWADALLVLGQVDPRVLGFPVGNVKHCAWPLSIHGSQMNSKKVGWIPQQEGTPAAGAEVWAWRHYGDSAREELWVLTGKSITHTENGRQKPAKTLASLVAEGLLCVLLTLHPLQSDAWWIDSHTLSMAGWGPYDQVLGSGRLEIQHTTCCLCQ